MPDKNIDIKKIQELIEIMKANGLEELEIQEGDSKVVLKRHFPHSGRHFVAAGLPVSAQTAAESAASAADAAAQAGTQHEKNLIEIKSPIVGTFYAKPSPDAEPYVEVGAKVDTRTVVCIIEAMKVMNEIRAETDGTIVEVCITNGQAVEFGQVLFKVRPD
jgi:acetyl-CoA carboxylase biotin carboxyl carrier protein